MAKREAWLGGLAVSVLAVVFAAGWATCLWRLGPAQARSYLVIRGLIALAVAVVPISSVRWVQAHPAIVPAFAKRVAVMLELVVAAAATIALVATSGWWAARAGIAHPPAVLIAAAALQHGATRLCRSVVKIGVAPLDAIRASLATLAQFSLPPLFAIAHGSLGAVLGGGGVTSIAIAAWVMRVPARASGEPVLPRPLIHPPAWIGDIAAALPRIVIAIGIAGAFIIPYESAGLLAWLMFMPFMGVALPQVSGLAPKLLRGVLLAATCGTLISAVGPALYRAVFPGWFGGAALVRCYAWSAIALVPLSYYKKRKGEPDWRTAVTSLASIAAMIVLVPMRGVIGVVNAQVVRLTVAAVLGIADPTRREEQLLG